MTEAVRLTSYSHGAGCACKLSPDDLARVLELLGPGAAPPDERVLVGYETADDAAVFRLRDDVAIVFTADFFTPIVDDAYDWGRVAATNALSDIYAMGADPLMVLNIVAWPREGLPLDLLAEVLRGGREVAAGAGAAVVGGHSIDDPEPKYGMAAVGIVHPDEVIRNAGGSPGDALVLTKPLGTGVVSTALKRGVADPATLALAVEVMTTLNGAAAGVARARGLVGGTDVTGFGLLGHLRELARASGCDAEIEASAVPVMAGVEALIEAGMVAGGTKRNRDFVEPWVEWDGVDETGRWLLTDAQTSGGLLLCVPPDRLDGTVADLRAAGALAAAVIGRLVEPAGSGEPGRIRVS